ncbi:hypothetical protein Aam_149_018 [Acidocella aminolytica 101 = DSM 11237]|uniref:Uncharacterized protein n=1 Tax=Acidocella aminolytica 101 = DSM 11237 TaxID=1120923 RepID=A0A0D6PK66_9PROT|nr:hypothetical protein Aam_149_018 [Acidocella aminolytica 101 = DSM 11237]
MLPTWLSAAEGATGPRNRSGKRAAVHYKGTLESRWEPLPHRRGQGFEKARISQVTGQRGVSTSGGDSRVN